jgi:23S rRNA-/tRNA-specific pseudouridylate synthase
VLEHLTKLVSIPRKRKYFSTFLERSCRVEDEKLSEQIYESIVLKDEELHSQKLKDLPLDRVSITHLSEEYCGHRLFQVHRLDMETSGIIVQAKHESACAELCRQFREREVRSFFNCATHPRLIMLFCQQISKAYAAKVFGKVPESMTKIETPIRADYPRRPLQVRW